MTKTFDTSDRIEFLDKHLKVLHARAAEISEQSSALKAKAKEIEEQINEIAIELVSLLTSPGCP